jgi:hypothetical protein
MFTVTTHFVRLFGVFCGLLCVIGLSPQAAAQDSKPAAPAHFKTVSDSTARVLFDETAFYGPSTASPYWDKGFLISHEIETFQPNAPNIRVYDKSGHNILRATIWFPDSQRVVISSAAVTSDRRILATGEADKPDGTRAFFIVSTDPEGKVSTVIQTGDFHPRHICESPDGSAWAFGGMAWDETTNRPKQGDTLRHFDLKKGQIGAYLPRSTFPDQGNYDDGLTHIRCTAQSVIVYSSTASTYITLDYSPDTPKIYRVLIPSPGLRAVGFAVSKAGDVYGYLTHASDKNRSGDGLYSLTVDQAALIARWTPVQTASAGTAKSGTVFQVWGADGEDLVVGRREDPAGSLALHWVPVVEN